jgi:hypothetical protein
LRCARLSGRRLVNGDTGVLGELSDAGEFRDAVLNRRGVAGDGLAPFEVLYDWGPDVTD